MMKSSKGSKKLAAFKTSMKVEVRQPEFEPMSSLSTLDFKKLSKGNHKIELGFVHGGCCRKLVRAVVKNGMVTGCEVEPCKGSKQKPSSDVLAVVAQARKKIGANKKWKPITVKALVGSTAQMQNLIIIGGGCIFICCFGHCIMCCWFPHPHCFFPDIYTGPL